MKHNYGLFSLVTFALLGGAMISCTNDLKSPSLNGSDRLQSPVKTPDVVAWSGNQTFRNTFNGTTTTGTRAENANANEWADPDKAYGGWVVPDPLTEGQKLRVKAYFQTHPNLTFEDPHWNNFFVQQVYKGHTNVPEGCATPEIYTSANGSTTSTSDNMDLMTVGQGNVHINNFNGGTASVNDKVLSNGGNANDGPFHSDQIMLMVDIEDTSCFGYHETNGSKHHNDKAALVSAAVIDEWAKTQNPVPGEAVVDKWNRSFLGFDLELLVTEDVKTDTSVKYWDIPGQPDYILKDGEYIKIEDKSLELLFNNLPVYYISTNSNQYLGETKEFQDPDLTGEYRDVNNNNQYIGKYVDIDFVYNLLEQGWLPAQGGAFKKWVKVEGGDGYYSDWIVCVTKAQKIDDASEEKPGPTPGETCEKCEHPKHDPSHCEKCEDNEGCNKKDDPSTSNPDTKPETPEVTEGVCDNCGHDIMWDTALGMFVHVNRAVDSPQECQECVDEGKTQHACSNPVLHEGETGIPETPAPSDQTKWDSEVEINLSIQDVHTLPNGQNKYDIDDLVSKLSIHVRYPHDVEVILPVPQSIYCDQDDLYILKDHYFDAEGEPNWRYGGETVEYTQIVGNETVTLNIEFVSSEHDHLTASGDGYIRVWTTGINEEVIDYCRENFGDGINFEVYNYYNRGNKYSTGNYITVTEEELQYKYLSHSMVNFDWDEPFATKLYPRFYINAFNQKEDMPVKGDCYVWIFGDTRANIGNVYSDQGIEENNQRQKYLDPYQGTHFNGSPLNWIYTLESLPGAIDSDDMPENNNWPFDESNAPYQYFRNIVNGVSTDNFSFKK